MTRKQFWMNEWMDDIFAYKSVGCFYFFFLFYYNALKRPEFDKTVILIRKKIFDGCMDEWMTFLPT